jgi:hypothetical protein
VCFCAQSCFLNIKPRLFVSLLYNYVPPDKIIIRYKSVHKYRVNAWNLRYFNVLLLKILTAKECKLNVFRQTIWSNFYILLWESPSIATSGANTAVVKNGISSVQSQVSALLSLITVHGYIKRWFHTAFGMQPPKKMHKWLKLFNKANCICKGKSPSTWVIEVKFNKICMASICSPRSTKHTAQQLTMPQLTVLKFLWCLEVTSIRYCSTSGPRHRCSLHILLCNLSKC